ncbi:unnamed protein product [Zymoseptoria tritici ST99CH_3D7]|uniref:Uncharacterized protein n=1 Tax=Zymoseptoria tritici (strain ST99CH_3D7) TaxID=1276538 RepID=A0A1X7RT81_ZYMT9|nr:unnamed protein product [Zymoseptoria tritici ST99CH_3D7]
MLAISKGQIPAIVLLCIVCLVSYNFVVTLQARTVYLESTIEVFKARAHRKHQASTTPSSQPSSSRDLILYSYHETAESLLNLAFFRAHALHSAADFIFMLNGAHTLDLSSLTSFPNVRVIERDNRCFDLGGFYEILTGNTTLTEIYKRYIFINSSLRGPFFPPWADKTCWSDAYWDKLDEKTKLVGMSWNCANGIPYPPHLQSMILAFSHETLMDTLLPNMKCYENMDSAVRDGETRLAGLIAESGGNVYAMEGRFGAHAGVGGKDTEKFLEWCVDGEGTVEGHGGGNDVLHTGNYEGSSLHPYETIFAKTNRDWDERDRRIIDLLTDHADLSNYSSYDRCGI